jgi:protein phosphatase
MDRSGWWDEFATSWICLDAEIMPWSSKAQDLLRHQYAPAGTAARESLAAAVRVLAEETARNDGGSVLLKKFEERNACIDQYIQAYGRYCWPVRSVSDLKIAPFHVLASQGKVHTNQNHTWHMEKLSQLCAADDGLLYATAFKTVNVTDPESEQSGIQTGANFAETMAHELFGPYIGKCVRRGSRRNDRQLPASRTRRGSSQTN